MPMETTFDGLALSPFHFPERNTRSAKACICGREPRWTPGDAVLPVHHELFGVCGTGAACAARHGPRCADVRASEHGIAVFFDAHSRARSHRADGLLSHKVLGEAKVKGC